MPPRLVTSVAPAQPCTPLALPRDRTTDQPQSDQLNFLPFAEWEEGGKYDKEHPRYVCYTIEWNIILNRKAVGGVTKKDLVVAPSEYNQRDSFTDLE
jgi:hypothetical protein